MRFDQGRYKEARALLEDALSIKEPNPYAHNNLGMVLLQTGDPDGARKHFETAIKQRPDYGQIYNNLGVLMWREGNLQGAAKRFCKALELIPDYIDARRNLVELLGVLPLPKDPVQAVRAVEEMCASLQESMPTILEPLAALLEREGRHALAREAERRCRELRDSKGR
jgi:Tfp pilus assembly protein PilF